MISETTFTVFMHPTLVDELGGCMSPGDGLAAIDQIFLGLPSLHPQPPTQTSRRRKLLKLYRGRFGWLDLGFSYVQLGPELHILTLWADEYWNNSSRQEVDVVLALRHGGAR